MPRNELTGYAQVLKKQERFPLQPTRPWKTRENKRAATPYLVVPNHPADDGQRPLGAGHNPDFSTAIEILDPKTQQPVTAPITGAKYALRCTVRNLGTVGSHAGIVEFYTSVPSALDAIPKGTGARPCLVGYAGLHVAAGAQSSVVCQKPWTFAKSSSAILVRSYDPLIDMVGSSYDYQTDRHVARRDVLLLDQHNEPEWKGAAVNVLRSNHVGQTFTPALPRLAAVEIAVRTGNPGAGGDVLTLLVIDGGKTLFIAQVTLPQGFDGFARFDLAPRLPVSVGKKILMEVHDTGKNVFHWKYAGGHTYAGGEAMFGGKTFDTNNFYFRTYGEL